MKRVPLLPLLAGLLLAACGGDAAPQAGPERCEMPLTVPDGFEVTGGIEDPYQDRIGVRVDMKGAGGRELHYFAGIPGEFGEGLPPAGTVGTPGGGGGTLVGSGDVWVLIWDEGTACDPKVVLGSGLPKREFVEVVRQAGAVQDT